jgi:hypothetical membrane protein
MNTSTPGTTINPLERFLAILGAIVCLIITFTIWRSIRAQQPMWPLPGFYFLEMMALSIVGAFIVVYGDPHRMIFVWSFIGIFIAFSIVGAFSVGFFYLPVALIFGLTATLSDIRNKQSIFLDIGVCLIAGVAQAVLMLAITQLLYPSAVF